MLRSETSQREISEYLKQIRIAINKDFVHFFLGAKSIVSQRGGGRDFFLSHNSKTFLELFEIKNNDNLAVIVDGSYERIQSSKNHDAQYKYFYYFCILN